MAPCRGPSHVTEGLVCVTPATQKKGRCSDAELRSYKTPQLGLAPSLWEKLITMSREVHTQGTRASSHQPCECADSTSAKTLATSTQLRRSRMPEPRNCKLENNCCLKALHFGVTYYRAIDN